MTRLDPQQGQPHSAPPEPANRKRRRWPWIVGGILGALVVLGAIANAVNPTPTPEQAAAGPAQPAVPPPAAASSPTATPVAAAPIAPPTAAQPDWIRICKMTDGDGIFYLNITSAAAHNFSDCGGRPAWYSGTIDNLFNLPGMDRRCMTGNADVAQEQAIIGVYSDTKKPDLAAAKTFCSTKGWSNQ